MCIRDSFYPLPKPDRVIPVAMFLVPQDGLSDEVRNAVSCGKGREWYFLMYYTVRGRENYVDVIGYRITWIEEVKSFFVSPLSSEEVDVLTKYVAEKEGSTSPSETSEPQLEEHASNEHEESSDEHLLEGANTGEFST